MARYSALFDANVLFSRELRYLFVALARTQLFRARWTKSIHEEWTRHVQGRYRDISPEKIAQMSKDMDAAVPDSLIEDYENLIPSLVLPDNDDRHVFAAAIKGRVDVIVTSNIRDFPENELTKYGIEAQTPDEFLSYLLDLHPEPVCEVIQEARLRLKSPPKTVWEYLEFMKTGLRLEETVKMLLEHTEEI